VVAIAIHKEREYFPRAFFVQTEYSAESKKLDSQGHITIRTLIFMSDLTYSPRKHRHSHAVTSKIIVYYAVGVLFDSFTRQLNSTGYDLLL
jgi:hypothetical protein